MNNKQRTLAYIKAHPGHTARTLAIALGVRREDSMKLRESEKEGLIWWDDKLNGWVKTEATN